MIKRYADVMIWALKSDIITKKEWEKRWDSGYLPATCPKSPQKEFPKEFTNWNDFLGTEPITFKDALDWAETHNVKPLGDVIKALVKSSKKRTLKEWIAFFGTKQRTRYITYEETKAWGQEQGFKSSIQWMATGQAGKIPYNIPSYPHIFYQEFEGWRMFLDTCDEGGKIEFEKMKAAAKRLKIHSQIEWARKIKSGKLPKHFSKDPKKTHSKHWKSWKDFLSLPEKTSFSAAKRWARKNKITSRSQWQNAAKNGALPLNLPKFPETHYEEFSGWGDFLGTGRIATRERIYRNYKAAKKWAKQSGIKTCTEWKEKYSAGKLPDDLPYCPLQSYKDKFEGWRSFLGTERRKQPRVGNQYQKEA